MVSAGGSVRGQSVVVAGAGLAGLTAAVELHRDGAQVTVLDARDRVGGRVWTLRDVFHEGQHAEAGGDLIEDDHVEVRRLAAQLGLKLAPILRRGFSFVQQGPGGRPLRPIRRIGGLWARLGNRLAPLVRSYHFADQRWDSPIVRMLARVSVADWFDQVKADAELRALVWGLRGFFLADPGDLALLTLVDQLASEAPGRGTFYRVKGGNDRLTAGLAAILGERVHLRTTLVAASQARGAVRVTAHTAEGGQAQLVADYLILALPATTLRSIALTPPLPPKHSQAIAQLKYGRATKTLLQFARGFWRAPRRATAYGTNLPIGAIWDGNEEQPGKAGILTLLAGGSASPETQKLVAEHGIEGLVCALGWLGATGIPVLASRLISWDDDPWARGGYAYFDPTYDPALRAWLARPHGRILFAGEHTSFQWQGYMNGAVESGLRAAAEVRALVWQAAHRRKR